MSQSPYTEMFEAPRAGIIRQELITYEIKDGVTRKISTVRDFYSDDYVDTQTITVLAAK